MSESVSETYKKWGDEIRAAYAHETPEFSKSWRGAGTWAFMSGRAEGVYAPGAEVSVQASPATPVRFVLNSLMQCSREVWMAHARRSGIDYDTARAAWGAWTANEARMYVGPVSSAMARNGEPTVVRSAGSGTA